MSRNSLSIIGAAGAALVLIGGYVLLHQQNEIHALTLETAVAGTGYSALVAEWTPIVPQVNCNWKDASQDDGGSGVLLRGSTGTFYILTNAHVVTSDKSKKIAQSCDIVFPDAASTTYTVAHGQITIDPNGVDAALLQIPEDPYLTDLAFTNQRKICTSPPNIGDNMLVLGYPWAGSSNGITATEGIVAGDEGSNFISSAKSDAGSSGGAAIDVKNDCYFGIPSYTITGVYTNLARVMKWNSLFTDDPAKLSEARL